MDLGTGEPLQLPGFGVELAIKNMEYSAMDDSKVTNLLPHLPLIALLRPYPPRSATYTKGVSGLSHTVRQSHVLEAL